MHLKNWQVKRNRGEDWSDDVMQPLLCKRQLLKRDEYDIQHERFMDWMGQAGFLGIFQIGYMRVDGALMTSLIERWRPETHTFHMPEGEMTITLQDVAVLLGLPIDGAVITGNSYVDVVEYCGRWLGIIPESSDIKFYRLSLRWLADNFDLTTLPTDASDGDIQRYARATILRFIGGDLFGTKTDGYVHSMYFSFVQDLRDMQTYSWGSACLAQLYRQLCCASAPGVHQVAGPLLLLQLWAWERFDLCRPILQNGAIHIPNHCLGTRYVTQNVMLMINCNPTE